MVSGLFGGQSQAKTQQVVQSSEPPKYLAPFLTDIAGKSQDAYNQFISSGYNQPYSGQRSAGQNPYDLLANSRALSTANAFDATGAPQNTFDLGAHFMDKVNSGAYTAPASMAFDPGTNDYVQSNIMAQVKPLLNQFNEQTIPRLSSAAIDSGAYGGSKGQDLAARTTRDMSANIGDIASKIAYQNFNDTRTLNQTDLNQRRSLMPYLNNNELSAAQGAVGLQNSGLAQGLQTSDIYSNIADRNRSFSQQAIDDAMAQYNEQVNTPWAGLGQYAGLIHGTELPGMGTQNKTTSGFQPSAAPFLQGLAGLGSLGSSLGTGGMISSGVGALAGIQGPMDFASLLSGLPWSDRRLKKNIRFERKENGHNIYSFNYIWDEGKRFLGVIAQDILRYLPEAVAQVGGFWTVDYSKLGVEMKHA